MWWEEPRYRREIVYRPRISQSEMGKLEPRHATDCIPGDGAPVTRCYPEITAWLDYNRFISPFYEKRFVI